MGKYQEITRLIEHSVPDYASLKIVPRGTPIFPDLLMSGRVRFARRTGANFSVLNPDNQFFLSAPGEVDQQTLPVTKILDWLEEGALITFNRTEMLEVQTWDPTEKTIQVAQRLSARRETGAQIDLWATPLKIHFDSPSGTTQLYVRSRYQIVNGDAITFPISESLNSLQQIDVLDASQAGTDLDPDFPYIYTLTLAQALPITMLAGVSLCYLRAFPSYVSQVLNVPKLRNAQMGPFLLDFLASPLNSIARYDETFSIRTIASGNTMVEGGINSFKTVNHNHPIVNRPIYGENMIFWKMRRGYGGFIKPNRFRMVTTEQMTGSTEWVARVQSRMVPPLPAGIRYDFRVQATTAGKIIAIPYPHAPITLNIAANTPTVFTVETPNGGAPIQRLDFLFTTTRENTEVTISDATLPVDPVVGQFQYQYVFRVLGSTNFQATSVIVKPYFLSLADLSARYNDGKSYNSGFIYL